MVFLPRGHRMEGTASVKMADLAAESAPCFSKQIHGLCLDAGFRPKGVQEATRGQAVAVMVAAGTGVAILPASMARIVGESSVAIPITAKGAAVTYVFAHRPGEQAPTLKDFVAGLERWLPSTKWTS